MHGIGPELPLNSDIKFGNFGLITNFKDQVKQNFKNLLLTSPGERIMNGDFGVGLRNYLFEPRFIAVPKIKQRIKQQVDRYMPFIRINNIFFDSHQDPEIAAESPVLSIEVQYDVPSLNFSSELILQNEDMN
tara:strand:- start:474 stop:869 length:396 start_codon:yes stop_codon:yes gene_type:complete